MNKKLLAFLFASCFITTAHAGFKQEVKVELNVRNDDPSVSFQTFFASTDMFDGGHTSRVIKHGHATIQHTYSHGPKNMGVLLATLNSYTLLIPDYSCNEEFHSRQREGKIVTKGRYLRLHHPHEYFYFEVRPIAETGRYVYTVSCRHESY